MAGFLKNTYTLRGALTLAEPRKDDSGNVIPRKAGDLDLIINNDFSGKMYPKLKGHKNLDKEMNLKIWDNTLQGMKEKVVPWKDRLLPKSIEGMRDDKLIIFSDGVTTLKFLSRYDLAEHLAKNPKVLEGKLWECLVDVDPYIMDGRSGITPNIRSIKPLIPVEGMPVMHTFEMKLHFSDNLVEPNMRDATGELLVTAETLGNGFELQTYLKHNAWDKETQVSHACLLPFTTRVKLNPELITPELVETYKAILSPFAMNAPKMYVMGFEGILKREATEDKPLTLNDLTAFEKRMVNAGVRKLEDYARVKSKGKAENVAIITAPSFAFDAGTEIDAELKKDKIFADSEIILAGGTPKVGKDEPVIPKTPPVEEAPVSATATLFGGGAGGAKFPF